MSSERVAPAPAGEPPDEPGDRVTREVTVRAAARRGVLDVLPLCVPAVPFGLVIGLAVADSHRIPDVVGWSSAWLMFAGASQLSAITLLAAGAPAVSAIVAAVVINVRHLMYSAALVPRFRNQPRWFRILGPYLLIDQIFAVSFSRKDESPDRWRAHYLAAGSTMWVIWQLSVAAGLVLGPILPKSLDLSFIAPALFLSLLVPSLARRPAVVGVLAAVVVTAGLASLPNRGGMLIGAVAGVAAATVADRLSARRSDPTTVQGVDG